MSTVLIRTAAIFTLFCGAITIFYLLSPYTITKSKPFLTEIYFNTSKHTGTTKKLYDQNYLNYEYWGITQTYTNKNYTWFIQQYHDLMDALSSKSITKTSQTLKRFQMQDVVHCFDSLVNNRNRPFHIAFIGDSLVRNQFTSFLSVSY